MYRAGRLAIDHADLSPAQDRAEEMLTSLAVRRQLVLHACVIQELSLPIAFTTDSYTTRAR